MDNQLGFTGVPFLFARVILALGLIVTGPTGRLLSGINNGEQIRIRAGYVAQAWATFLPSPRLGGLTVLTLAVARSGMSVDIDY
jgi:hypothetical protein